MRGPEPDSLAWRLAGPQFAPGTLRSQAPQRAIALAGGQNGRLSEFRIQILGLIVQFFKEFRFQEDTVVY